MKFFVTTLIVSFLSLSAFAKADYCKEGGGRTTIDSSNNKIVITVKGIGEEDGTLNFIDLKSRQIVEDEVEMYSDFLKLPVAAGTVTFANLVSGSNKVKAQILEITTKADRNGKEHKILLVSVAGDTPSYMGMDTSCQK